MSGKIIGIIGSPRKDGNCVKIVSRILESAEAAGNETEMYSIHEMGGGPCIACMGCKKAGQGCVRKDGFTPAYESMKECDVVVFATPVYFGHCTAQARAFEDRMYGFMGPDGCCLKPGMRFVPVVTSSAGIGSAETMAEVKRFFTQYFKMECAGEIEFNEGAAKAPAKDDQNVMSEAERIGGSL